MPQSWEMHLTHFLHMALKSSPNTRFGHVAPRQIFGRHLLSPNSPSGTKAPNLGRLDFMRLVYFFP